MLCARISPESDGFLLSFSSGLQHPRQRGPALQSALQPAPRPARTGNNKLLGEAFFYTISKHVSEEKKVEFLFDPFH